MCGGLNIKEVKVKALFSQSLLLSALLQSVVVEEKKTEEEEEERGQRSKRASGVMCKHYFSLPPFSSK